MVEARCKPIGLMCVKPRPIISDELGRPVPITMELVSTGPNC
jgi:hypothetical protein